MVVAARDFLDRLAESGLISESELSSMRRDVPEHQQTPYAQGFVRTLVEKGKLTEYQAKAICEGKAKSLVFGEYVVLERLGQGGMGVVFKARHKRMDRLVAIKILPSSATGSSEALERFYREVKAAARLHHPNIVTAYDAGECEGVHYLVMEYVDGKDLAAVARQYGTVPIDRAVDWIIQAARGLEYAHRQGIIHRDVKLANLLLDREGTVKVLDMGLARMIGSADSMDQITSDHEVMGTYGYMAPEQAEDARRVDHRADVYSLGCSLYRLVTGKAIYQRETPVGMALAHRDAPIPSLLSARADVPPPLDAIFQKMVAKSPEDRYSSMTEVIAALEGLGLTPARPAGNSSRILEAASSARLSAEDEAKEDLPGTPTRTYLDGQGSAGRRKLTGVGAIFAGFLILLGLAAVIIRVRDQQGRETTVRAPAGSEVQIGAAGEIEVTLPGEVGRPVANAQPDFEPDAPPTYGQDAPKPAVAPFPPDDARRHQDRWAAYLNVAREETNSVGMALVLIPPGEFEMGSTVEEVDALVVEAKAANDAWLAKHLPNEAPRRRVRLTTAFRMGAHEVTVAQFRHFVNATGYRTEGEQYGQGEVARDRGAGGERQPEITWSNPGFPQTDEHPVTVLTWNDAAAFCRWLGAKEGKRYLLPTEAEWEFACRAGSVERYCCGNDALQMRGWAWSGEGSRGKSHPVGQKKANAFGLFDMHGNVWEWCADWYDPRCYSSGPMAVDPRGPESAGAKVIRGGSADYNDLYARSANRAFSPPFRRAPSLGFRVVVPVLARQEQAQPQPRETQPAGEKS